MKIPRMSVRNLMLAVLLFAVVWGAIETASRRESYHLKAASHARREKQIRSFRDGWIEVIARADKLLKEDADRREAGEIEKLDKLIDNIYERYTCSSLDYEIVNLMVATDLTVLDERLSRVITTARKNVSILEPLLAYHESLRAKYRRAEGRPWQKAPPDPPMPRAPHVP